MKNLASLIYFCYTLNVDKLFAIFRSNNRQRNNYYYCSVWFSTFQTLLFGLCAYSDKRKILLQKQYT